MSSSSRKLDRLQATFDHDGIVANAGLIVPATLMVRLGLEALIDRWVKTGSARPGRKILTLVAEMLAGGTHIDRVNMLRAWATQRVQPFGHVRQLDAVLSRTLARAWMAGAGPGDGPLIVDLDSTICEVHGKHKQAVGCGYTKVLGYHRCSPPEPGPAKCSCRGCARAPRTPHAGSSASLTNSPST